MKPITQFLAERAPGQVSHPPVQVISCATCQDTRYVRKDYPTDHPLFGQVFPCPDCNRQALVTPDAYGLLQSDHLLAWDGVLELDPSISAALQAVRETLSKGHGWVYLWGGYGVAKTALLKVAVAEHLRSLAQPAAYLRLIDMIDEIRTAYDAQFPNTAAMSKVRWFSTLPLLAIDELEKVKETGFVEERRFQVLDARYEVTTRQNYGVTLLAANVPPDALPGAIASRINDARFRVVHITAKDIRPMAEEF